jgi:hypothetical protein
MPWSAKDAKRHSKKAKSPKRKRQWGHVANSILERTGDEARAVRGANSVIKKGSGASGRTGKFTHGKKKRKSGRKSTR